MTPIYAKHYRPLICMIKADHNKEYIYQALNNQATKTTHFTNLRRVLNCLNITASQMS